MIDMQSEHVRLTGDDILSEAEIVSRAQRRIRFSGIYFLIKDDWIVYVGQAQDVEEQIAQHRKTKDFDEFTYIQAFGEQLDVLESIYIHHFQPELNARHSYGIAAPLPAESIRSCSASLKALGTASLPAKHDDQPEAVLNLGFLNQA